MRQGLDGIRLPAGCHFKHGGYYRVVKNKWHFLGRDPDCLTPYFAGQKGLKRPASRKNERSLASYMAAVYGRAERNARARGIAFRLTRREFESILERADEKCELTGIPFSMEFLPFARRRPWAPSLDRIEASAPYTRSNCRLVCIAVNSALGEWGEPVLLRIAAALATGRE